MWSWRKWWRHGYELAIACCPKSNNPLPKPVRSSLEFYCGLSVSASHISIVILIHDDVMILTHSTLLPFMGGNHTPVSVEFPSHRASDVDLWCFLCCYLERAIEPTVNVAMIWDFMKYSLHQKSDGILWLSLFYMFIIHTVCSIATCSMSLLIRCTPISPQNTTLIIFMILHLIYYSQIVCLSNSSNWIFFMQYSYIYAHYNIHIYICTYVHMVSSYI